MWVDGQLSNWLSSPPLSRLAFVMEIKSEVFGRCVEEIDVSVEFKNGYILFCCEWKYLRFLLVEKAAQDWRWRWEMVPGIGSTFRGFWVFMNK